MRRLDLRLLGGFEVTVDGRAVAHDAWDGRRPAQLVKMLALAPGHRLPAERVMDRLWPDLDPEAARANLHRAASRARGILGSREAVVLSTGMVSLAPGAERHVDVASFQAAATEALRSDDADRCVEAADLYGGELVPEEPYEEWAVQERERLRLLHHELLRRSGRWAALVDADPTDEEAHLRLIEEHRDAGRYHAAIRQFHRLRTVLARELGVPPRPETTAVYRQILGTATHSRPRPGLVGREVEMVRARALWRRAADGRPVGLFVSGEPGIGKTRLCTELLDSATADGWLVLRAQARHQDDIVPFGPIAEAVEEALLADDSLVGRLRAVDRDVLARLTGLRQRRGQAPMRRQAVLALLDRLARRPRSGSRTALFVDDLHAADAATLDLVSCLLASPPSHGMAVVATFRPGPANPALAELVARARAAGTGIEVALGPLSRSEAVAIAEDVTGRAPSAEESALVWDLARGNPFFTVEIASALTRDPDVSSLGGLEDVIDARLQLLPAPVRDAVRDAAMVASEFSADEFALFTGADADMALDLLEQAVRAGALEQQGSTYRFRHALLRDALVRDVPHSRRAAAHRAAGERLAARGAGAGRVAHHLLEAGDPALALPWLKQAAVEAAGLGAHADALVIADRGLEVSPREPELLELRAEALHALGNKRAPAAFAVAQAANQGAARDRIRVRRARAQVASGDPMGALQVLQGVAAADPETHVQLLVNRGIARLLTGDTDGAGSDALDARRLAEAHGSLAGFVDVTMLRAMVAHEKGAWPELVELDLLDREVVPELAALVIDAHLCVAESYLYGGVPYPEVVDFAEGMRARAAAAGAARGEAFASTLLGEALLLMGEPSAARPPLTRALELHRDVGVLCGEALTLQRLAEVAVAEGSSREGEECLDEALVAARTSVFATRHLLDRIHGTMIRIAADPTSAMAAVEAAERCIRGPFETCPPCSITLAVPAAVACATAGEVARARGFLTAAETVVPAFWRQGGWYAALDEARAHLSLAEGDRAGARALFARAAGGFEQCGQRLDAARCVAQATAVDPGAGKVSGRSAL